MEGQFKVIKNVTIDAAQTELNKLLESNYVKILSQSETTKSITHTLYLKDRTSKQVSSDK